MAGWGAALSWLDLETLDQRQDLRENHLEHLREVASVELDQFNEHQLDEVRAAAQFIQHAPGCIADKLLDRVPGGSLEQGQDLLERMLVNDEFAENGFLVL